MKNGAFEMSSFERLTAEEVKRLMDDEGYLFLDVRSVPEYDEEHAAGAYNVPFLNKTDQGMTSNPDFSEVVQGLITDKTSGIITSCQMGGRSVRAAQELTNLGFSKVVDLRGGFAGEKDGTGKVTLEGWKGSGFATESGSNSERGYEAVRAGLSSAAETSPDEKEQGGHDHDHGAPPAIPSGERWAHPERRVVCAKLKEEFPAMRRKPMGGPMGIKLKKEISAPAWEMWVEHSKMIINEYRLNPADAKAQEMLLKQCEEFFYGDGGVKPPEFVQEGSEPKQD